MDHLWVYHFEHFNIWIQLKHIVFYVTTTLIYLNEMNNNTKKYYTWFFSWNQHNEVGYHSTISITFIFREINQISTPNDIFNKDSFFLTFFLLSNGKKFQLHKSNFFGSCSKSELTTKIYKGSLPTCSNNESCCFKTVKCLRRL